MDSIGFLFENFFIIEKMKNNSNQGNYASYYFWRTYEKYEIDLIEDYNANLSGYECKWSDAQITKSQHVFINEYPNAKVYIVHKDNYTDFLS